MRPLTRRFTQRPSLGSRGVEYKSAGWSPATNTAPQDVGMARRVMSCVKRWRTLGLILFLTPPYSLLGQATLPEAFQCPRCDDPTHPPEYTVLPSLTNYGGSPPGPYTQPSIDQTRAYINSQPALRTLDPAFKDVITYSGPVSGLLNSPYLPNGQPNPFMNANGTITPNWYLRSTWPSTGVNWQGVNPNGFLPTPSTSLYINSFIAPYNPNSSVNSSSTYHYQPTYQPPRQTFPQPNNVQRPVQPPNQLTKTLTEGYRTVGPQPGDIQKAQEGREHALALSEAAGDKVGEAINHAALAEIFVYQDNPQQAFKHLGLAEPLVNSLGDPKLQANLYRIRGAAFLSSGDYEQALAAYRLAMPLLRSQNDENGQAEIYASVGWVYQSLGEAPKALGCYESALILSVRSRNKEGQVKARLGMGLLYRSLGEANKALEQYRSALPIAQKPEQPGILSSIAELYQSRNELAMALINYEKALELIRSSDDRAGEAAVLTGMGRCYMLGSPQKARGLFDQARSLLEKAGNRAGEAGVIASMGELDYWNGISPLYFGVDSRGRYFPKALKHDNEALSLMCATGNRTGEIGVLTNIGLVYDAWAKPHQALSYYTQALQKMDELQTYARLEEFRIDVAEQSANLYQRAILLAVHLKQTKEAFELSERARARTFLDQLGNKRIDVRAHTPVDSLREQELRRENISLERQLGQEIAKAAAEINPERIRSLELRLSEVRTEYERLLTGLKVSDPEYASFLSISPLALSEAQRQLPPDVTVVSYFTTPDMTLAFVITREKVHVAKLRVREPELTLAVATFLDFAGDSGTPPSLKQLHKWLIAPISSQLRTSMIAFVPHGVLHNLPFTALTPDGKQYLGDSHEIFYLPSVSALPYIHARTKPGSGQMLVLANDKEEGLPYLSHAYGEARAVASVFGTQPLLGDAATASVLRANGGDYDILHLIAHIERNNQTSQFARIMLASGQGDEGSLELHQVYGLDLRGTNLVVLSGCQSELGRQSRGDDIVGLSRAFMYAGAPSVIASLWSVDDEATQQFMVAFYDHLKDGMSKAEALRAAQVDIRHKYPNPYYWAGFVLTGDPGVMAKSGLVASSGSAKGAKTL